MSIFDIFFTASMIGMLTGYAFGNIPVSAYEKMIRNSIIGAVIGVASLVGFVITLVIFVNNR